MPLIAVAVAVAADIGAMGAFGAVLAGTATLGETFAVVAAVGATISAVGAVTGVKELQTAGMVIGAIGGVGALANAVGAFGESATMSSVFGGSSGAVDGDLAMAGQTSGSLINGASSTAANSFIDGDLAMAGESANSSSIIDAANNIGGFNVPGTTGAENVTDNLSSVVKPEALISSAPDATSAAANTTVDAVKTGAIDGDLAMAGDAGGAVSVTGKVADAASSGGLFGKGGFFSTSGGGMLGMGVVQAAGSFLSGAFDPLKPAQVDAYKAQAAANNASAALTNKQVGNMNEPIPIARRMAVTGKLGGMINSTPQGATA